MNYYEEIKNKIIDNEIYCKVKDYSKERNTVTTYFEIGRLLTEAGGKYGDNIIDEYSKKLVVEVGKKYNRRTLFRMKQFYKVFSNEKVSPVGTQLSWSNCRLLLSIKDYNEQPSLPDLIKNPILIKNTNKYNEISEKLLQKLILENISSFMQELGPCFSFIDNEYKIKIGNRYNYIDLLLYNIKFKCYVVIELKVKKLNSDHTGQIQNYMNYIDKNIKEIVDNKTVGIIICKKNNEYIIEYCSDKRIISREYKLMT